MRNIMKKSESMTVHALSQFELTSDLLRNLYKFDLTPVTKLVLLELTTHLNESRNGSVVFPSVGYIAEVLGIGLTACKKAINDLIKEGIIIKTKRNNVKGNYNKYLFTQKITSATIDFKAGKNENRYIYTPKDINSQKIASKPSENKLFKQSKNDFFFIETNNNEKINNKEEEYLKIYAQKRGARNVQAYITAIKKNGGITQIIENFKKNEKRQKIEDIKTKRFIEQLELDRKNAVPPTESWKALRNTIFKDYK